MASAGAEKLNVRQEEPFNAEPNPEDVTKQFITDEELTFVRSHGPVPHLDAEAYVLKVEVDGAAHNFSLERIKAFGEHELVALLQCTGNRRREMEDKFEGAVEGIDWTSALSNCKWTGARLADVLHAVGASAYRGKHVIFSSRTQAVQQDDFFQVSIPVEKALSSEVLLAWAMNGKPLTQRHGAPLRVITPGYTGVRSVKWLTHIRVDDQESSGFYQQFDYKVLPPHVKTHQQAQAYFPKVPALQIMPVLSAITRADLDGNRAQIHGYAFSGHGSIVRVEASLDKETWLEASIDQAASRWAWTLWSIRIPIEGDSFEAFSRAIDDAGNIQGEGEFNLRGVGFDGLGHAAFP